MKRIFIILALLLPVILHAGVIVKKSGERLEDISIKSASGSDIVYVTEEGTEVTLPKSEVSAILYDDGRYEEIQQESLSQSANVTNTYGAAGNSQREQSYTPLPMENGAKEYNVYAYGVYAGMGYFSGDKFDDIKVEYRIIYKSQQGEPSFQYLGTTPFAYVTDKMALNSFVGKGNPTLVNLMEPKPFVVPNDKDVKNIEFRLSKEGYKTTIVKPFKDLIIGCGPLLMISLDKLKPLKDGETNDTPEVAVIPILSSEEKSVSETGASNKQTKASSTAAISPSQRIIPQGCYTEGKNAYDAIYKEGQIQAVRRGYSKAQAISIAGEFAEQAKQKAIDECYDRIVVRDEDASLDASNSIDVSVSLFELYELSASAKKIIPQACTDEGKTVYDAAYAEAEAKALRQGYSKSQAKTIASEAAEKARQKAIDECYDKIVNKGEDYYSGGVITAKELKAQEAKAKEDAKAREAEEKRLAEERKKQEADSIKNAKEAEKIAAKENKKQPKAKTEGESAENNRKMLLGLSLGAGVPIAQWYRYYGQEQRDGESFGADIQASFDFAYPISQKFAMGLYAAGGGGLTFINELSKISGEKNMHSDNKSIMKATAGILMVMGDFANKGAFLLGFGAGFANTGWHAIGDIIPIEVRLGGVFKNGFYFDFDLNMTPFYVTPYDDFYIEPAVRLGYNFGNLFTLKKKEK